MSRFNRHPLAALAVAAIICLAPPAMPQSADLDATRPLNPPSRFGLNAVGYFHRP